MAGIDVAGRLLGEIGRLSALGRCKVTKIRRSISKGDLYHCKKTWKAECGLGSTN